MWSQTEIFDWENQHFHHQERSNQHLRDRQMKSLPYLQWLHLCSVKIFEYLAKNISDIISLDTVNKIIYCFQKLFNSFSIFIDYDKYILLFFHLDLFFNIKSNEVSKHTSTFIQILSVLDVSTTNWFFNYSFECYA